jgi:hypothetical protein
MRKAGLFTLHTEPATETLPARVSIALTGAVRDARGDLHVTGDCMTLDKLESCINTLQAELYGFRLIDSAVFWGRGGLTRRIPG